MKEEPPVIQEAEVAPETFQYNSPDGKSISLQSMKYDIFQLANMAAEFLGLNLIKDKKAPGYAQ